ncbi:MAG TPA: hypothetical protein VE753_00590 [Gaiellaceae bacterium]|nr:hypothetical protein [Gaiellaceae bacterium]
MARALGMRGRFFVAYLVLGALVGTGIGLFVVLLERPGATRWSSWRPDSRSAVAQAHEIVRIPPAQTEGSLRGIGIPLTARPRNLADFRRFDRDRSMMYQFCGPGQDCRISERTARTHEVALRREALEHALYTFKYSRPIQHVAIFFPRLPNQTEPDAALFFHRSDLAPELRLPLEATLRRSPPLAGDIGPAETRTVERLTAQRVYRYLGIAKAGDFGDLVVLSPAG